MKISEIFQFESQTRQRKFLSFIKDTILYRELLTEFEVDFTKDLSLRYRNFKFNMMLSSTQMKIVNEIAAKLLSDIDFSYKEIKYVKAVEETSKDNKQPI